MKTKQMRKHIGIIFSEFDLCGKTHKKARSRLRKMVGRGVAPLDLCDSAAQESASAARREPQPTRPGDRIKGWDEDEFDDIGGVCRRCGGDTSEVDDQVCDRHGRGK